jgi:hypothetical protein
MSFRVQMSFALDIASHQINWPNDILTDNNPAISNIKRTLNHNSTKHMIIEAEEMKTPRSLLTFRNISILTGRLPIETSPFRDTIASLPS